MIWVGIIGGIMVGPWKVLDSIKMTAHSYLVLLREHLEPWFKKVPYQKNH